MVQYRVLIYSSIDDRLMFTYNMKKLGSSVGCGFVEEAEIESKCSEIDDASRTEAPTQSWLSCIFLVMTSAPWPHVVADSQLHTSVTKTYDMQMLFLVTTLWAHGPKSKLYSARITSEKTWYHLWHAAGAIYGSLKTFFSKREYIFYLLHRLMQGLGLGLVGPLKITYK